ncbi:MAG: MBL fold metallo-hydrolase [Gammaproteobacteria bacterium]
MAKVTFLGAAREVTGSCHLLESPSTGRIILDCGMHQGGSPTSRLSRDNFEFDPETLDAVILSHAHLDHSGLLPKLVNRGFNGPIYCTTATAELLRIMLHDAYGLYKRELERDALHAQRKGKKPALKPEYTENDVEQVLDMCEPISYRTPRSLSPEANLSFFDAGHILGSAIVEITLTEQGKEKRLVFSGDLGNKDSKLMNDPEQLTRADLVLMESTYGNRNHRSMEETISQLTDILRETWERGGNIMIPAFAVGRTQEIIFYLGRLYHEGLLNDWQVFLDSPMATEVTRVYDRWLHLLDDNDIRSLEDADKESLEKFLPTLKISQTPQDSMAINEVESGAIIVAGSGMCTGGRIRHHIKHRIWREENTMLFAGFQAQGTLGRNLVEGAKKIRMFNDEFAVLARIETLGGFSAHAGQVELVEWAKAFEQGTKFALVHGEMLAMQVLATRLEAELGISVLMPEPNEQISF